MAFSQLLCVGLCIVLSTYSSDAAEKTKTPHVILLFADDLGANDIGYVNPDVVISPNVDELAATGIVFNNTYGAPSCSPSRVALLTGRYAYKLGLQHLVIQPTQKVCLPLDITMMQTTMQSLDYKTHMLGKWHMGFCNEKCLPTNRGFDSFLGIIEGGGDYFSHSSSGKYDFFNDTDVVEGKQGTHLSWFLAERSLDIIEKHDPTDPLFLYYAFSLPRTPVQVPKQYEDLYPNVENELRRKYLGMVSMMDEAVGNVTRLLKEKDMYDDSIIIWMSDNGGDPGSAGNNYPYRGGKNTIFEGGLRVPALISGGWVTPKEKTTDALVHVADILPTLLSALGHEDLIDDDFDGVSQWDLITNGGEGPRKDIIYNLDIHIDTYEPLAGYGAIRDETYKLIWGYPGKTDGWEKPAEMCQELTVVDSECNPANESVVYNDAYMTKWEHHYEEKKAEGIDDKLQLYNLITDPAERNDLSESMPEKVEELKEKLLKEMENVAFPLFGAMYDPQIANSWGKDVQTGWCTEEELTNSRAYSLEKKGLEKEEESSEEEDDPSSGSRVMVNQFLGLGLMMIMLALIY